MIDLPISDALTRDVSASKNTEDYVVALAGAIGKLEASMVVLTAEVAAMNRAMKPKPKAKGKKK